MRPSARRHAETAPSRSSTSIVLEGPGVELEGLLAPRGQRRVEHVERVEGLDAGHEVRDLVVDRHVAGERLVADLREAASTRRHEDAGPVEDQARVEALAQDAG